MAINPVFTVTDFVNFFKGLPPSIGSLYDNRPYYNCLYYSHDYNGLRVYTADCWNMIKAGIWGDLTLPQHIGEYWYYPGKYGLQDITGYQILQLCSDVSSDFSSIVPGEYLITNDYSHAGLYIGNVTTAAGTFNVVECTPIWANGIQYTWVDSDGTRRRKQGGEQSVYWARHAKLPWVDYSDTPPSPPDPPDPPQPPSPEPDRPAVNVYTYVVDSNVKYVDIIRDHNPGAVEKSVPLSTYDTVLIDLERFV